MIALSRVSQLVNKTNFFSRQRHAVNYSRKFVISDHDISSVSHTTAVIPFEDESHRFKLVEGFDPDGNKTDRRLLYEITGLRMRQDEVTD